MSPSSLRRRICWARKVTDDQQGVSGEVDGESMLEVESPNDYGPRGYIHQYARDSLLAQFLCCLTPRY